MSATQVNSRPSWYKIGENIFSESGNPIIIKAPKLKDLHDFAVIDTSKFQDICKEGIDFKILPSQNQNVSLLTYKIPGKVSETETHCKIIKIPTQAISEYNILRGLLDSPTKIDMTIYYQEIAKYSLAIPHYCISLKRVCDITDGYAFVGMKNYIEFNRTSLVKNPEEQLFVKEIYSSVGSRYFDSELTKYYHIMYNKKKYLIVEKEDTTIFLDQKPNVSTPSNLVVAHINKVLINQDKKLIWEIEENTHKDIKNNISGMHKMITSPTNKAILNLLSLEAKPSIKLKLSKNIPLSNISFSVLIPFQWNMRPDQKMEVYEIPNAIDNSKSIYEIQYKKNLNYKKEVATSKKKDKEENPPNWVVEKYAIITP
jgi:hypothetical protein